MLMRTTESLYSPNNAIKRKIDASYNANSSIWQMWQTQANLDVRLEAGDTTLMAQLNSTMPNNFHGQYYFNKVRPLLNMVGGHQRRNRKSTIVIPVENGDQPTADQWTKILMNIYRRENIDETFSEAFYQGACITGLNLLHVYIDWREDHISGDIKVENLPYNYIFMDPYFRQFNLSDCQFIWRRSMLTHSAAASLLPEHTDEIMSLPGNPTGLGRDGRFQWIPESYGLSQQNLIAYDEYYYRDYRTQKKLVDINTGDSLDITTQDDKDVDRFLAENPSVRLEKTEVPTVRLAIMVQDRVFYDGPNPLGIDDYPFVPVIGYYSPMLPYFYTRIQGIARSLRDPQMLLNRRIILSADLLESQVNSGFIFKENAVIDVKHLFQTGQGRIIPLKAEASLADIQQIQSPRIDASIFQLQETFSRMMNDVSGINEELMGMASDAKAGITEVLRQGAGLTTLQPLFDRADTSQKLLGQLMMKVIRANYTPGKIQQILENQPPAPLFYNKAFGKYHCVVELGFNTETQKQMQMAQLLQLKELGVPIPDAALINAATIQNKQEIIQMIQQQQEQQQQMQQQQAQVQMEELQARTQLAQARALADQGLGWERISRIEENKALAQERKAEAVKDDFQALLNFAKAIKELELLDFAPLERIVALQNMLKQTSVQNEAQPL